MGYPETSVKNYHCLLRNNTSAILILAVPFKRAHMCVCVWKMVCGIETNTENIEQTTVTRRGELYYYYYNYYYYYYYYHHHCCRRRRRRR
jgi:hypothetical protein